jgi:hypothetical protein
VFKSGKKSLKFDLAVIALLQLAALGWGVHLMYQERPLFLAFADDRFGTVARSQITGNKLPLDELLKLGENNPVRVFVKLPDNPRELFALKLSLLKQGRSVYSQTDRYEAMTPQNYQLIYRQSLNMDAFLTARPEFRAAYDAFVQKAGVDVKELEFFPLMCRYNNVILVLRSTDNGIAGSLDVAPPDYALFSKSWPQEKSGEK